MKYELYEQWATVFKSLLSFDSALELTEPPLAMKVPLKYFGISLSYGKPNTTVRV